MKSYFVRLALFLLLSYSLISCTPISGETQLSNQLQQETGTPENMSNADANVLYVKAVQEQDGKWTFSVTVEHPDTGWDDYVNGWNASLLDGTILKTESSSKFTRILLHPHVNEQPFTRSQSGIQIPADENIVIVAAHDLVDGFGGDEVVIDMTQNSGENYEVIRK